MAELQIERFLNNCLGETSFSNLGELYRGKVRDNYIQGDRRLLIATDRISAFDVVLPQPIPLKGQMLNQLSHWCLRRTEDIVPNHILDVPDPNVTAAKECRSYPVEMVGRGYLAGHALREYQAGKRVLCGAAMPDGLKPYEKFPEPLITPATKATSGHDEDISPAEIIARNIVPKEILEQMMAYALALFARGGELARKQGLILVDTKYEFGDYRGELTLMDEIHTPDSSRFFHLEGYEEQVAKGDEPYQLSKEFVRQWLIEHDFMGQAGTPPPDLPDDFRLQITSRYMDLYETMTGEKLQDPGDEPIAERIEKNLAAYRVS